MPRKKKLGPSVFSRTLRALMAEQKLSVREAASVAGVATSVIDSWRHGSNPDDFEAVKRLAKKFGVSLSFLLTGKDEDTTEKKSVSLTEIFEREGTLFDGYAKITIEKLSPRVPISDKKKESA